MPNKLKNTTTTTKNNLKLSKYLKCFELSKIANHFNLASFWFALLCEPKTVEQMYTCDCNHVMTIEILNDRYESCDACSGQHHIGVPCARLDLFDGSIARGGAVRTNRYHFRQSLNTFMPCIFESNRDRITLINSNYLANYQENKVVALAEKVVRCTCTRQISTVVTELSVHR